MKQLILCLGALLLWSCSGSPNIPVDSRTDLEKGGLSGPVKTIKRTVYEAETAGTEVIPGKIISNSVLREIGFLDTHLVRHYNQTGNLERAELLDPNDKSYSVTLFLYDDEHRLIREEESDEETGHSTTLIQYDNRGHRVKDILKTDRLPLSLVKTYQYNQGDGLITTTMNTFVKWIPFLGRMTGIIEENDVGPVTMTLQKKGELIWRRTFTRNDKGEILKEVVFDTNMPHGNTAVIDFRSTETDAHGNPVIIYAYLRRTENDSLDYSRPSYIILREITYY